MTDKVQTRGCISGLRWRAGNVALALALTLVLGALVTPSVQAQAFQVLYNFTGGADGALSPRRSDPRRGGQPLRTTFGGVYGYGTVFKVIR
jgi:hypothetical protein